MTDFPSSTGGGKVIWIDLDNTPHIPFFAPIIRELESSGYKVLLTARDAYQVLQLADYYGLQYKSFGHHWGKNWLLKVIGTCLRALRLAIYVMPKRPSLAVAHGSRSLVLVSKILMIPSLSIFDYEHTAGGVRATWTMAPDLIPRNPNRDPSKQLRYPGLKEDVYVADFRPDPTVMERLGLTKSGLIVLLRPPANEAHYRNPASDVLYSEAVDYLSSKPDITIVLLPRNAKQEAAARETWPGLIEARRIVIPPKAEDGLNIIWHSDLVISGGGTMNREAAALGVPVYSIFRGKIGAVDQHLAETKRLVLINEPSELEAKLKLEPRQKSKEGSIPERPALRAVLEQIIRLAELT